MDYLFVLLIKRTGFIFKRGVEFKSRIIESLFDTFDTDNFLQSMLNKNYKFFSSKNNRMFSELKRRLRDNHQIKVGFFEENLCYNKILNDHSSS